MSSNWGEQRRKATDHPQIWMVRCFSVQLFID